jgi:hypothetical protein
MHSLFVGGQSAMVMQPPIPPPPEPVVPAPVPVVWVEVVRLPVDMVPVAPPVPVVLVAPVGSKVPTRSVQLEAVTAAIAPAISHARAP